MTVKQAYEAILIELKKSGSPSLWPDEFNYFFNKSARQTVNIFSKKEDIDRFSTEHLRALRVPVEIDGDDIAYDPEWATSEKDAKYQINLPGNYLQILNCVSKLKSKGFQCYAKDQIVPVKTLRMTSDLETAVMDNAFLKPSYRRPYYMTGNSLEQLGIDFGMHADKFELSAVRMWYLREPVEIKITPEDLYSEEDTTDELEFQQYICDEVINRAILLIKGKDKEPDIPVFAQLNSTLPEAQAAQ